MKSGYQPKDTGKPVGSPPTSGSGVKPPEGWSPNPSGSGAVTPKSDGTSGLVTKDNESTLTPAHGGCPGRLTPEGQRQTIEAMKEQHREACPESNQSEVEELRVELDRSNGTRETLLARNAELVGDIGALKADARRLEKERDALRAQIGTMECDPGTGYPIIWVGNQDPCCSVGGLFATREAFDEYDRLTTGKRWAFRFTLKPTGWVASANARDDADDPPAEPCSCGDHKIGGVCPGDMGPGKPPSGGGLTEPKQFSVSIDGGAWQPMTAEQLAEVEIRFDRKEIRDYRSHIHFITEPAPEPEQSKADNVTQARKANQEGRQLAAMGWIIDEVERLGKPWAVEDEHGETLRGTLGDTMGRVRGLENGNHTGRLDHLQGRIDDLELCSGKLGSAAAERMKIADRLSALEAEHPHGGHTATPGPALDTDPRPEPVGPYPHATLQEAIGLANCLKDAVNDAQGCEDLSIAPKPPQWEHDSPRRRTANWEGLRLVIQRDGGTVRWWVSNDQDATVDPRMILVEGSTTPYDTSPAEGIYAMRRAVDFVEGAAALALASLNDGEQAQAGTASKPPILDRHSIEVAEKDALITELNFRIAALMEDPAEQRVYGLEGELALAEAKIRSMREHSGDYGFTEWAVANWIDPYTVMRVTPALIKGIGGEDAARKVLAEYVAGLNGEAITFPDRPVTPNRDAEHKPDVPTETPAGWPGVRAIDPTEPPAVIDIGCPAGCTHRVEVLNPSSATPESVVQAIRKQADMPARVTSSGTVKWTPHTPHQMTVKLTAAAEAYDATMAVGTPVDPGVDKPDPS